MAAASRETETVGDSAFEEPNEKVLLRPGDLLAGRWRIVKPLGRGGFAVVYLAQDELLQRVVAVKVLRPDRVSVGALRRLRREAALARDLSHANLIRVFDVEEAEGLVFLTLELAPGGSLRESMRNGPMPILKAVELALQIFEALAALHDVGIVHRDVKPANVLLGAQGEVKLSDFGLALLLDQDETRMTATEATVGTLQYLSPEQAMGEEVDVRSDLYSAGLVLFEMLTGRLPYGARSSLGHVVARFRSRPPSVRALRPEVPRWLARVVERLLERRREDRYVNARAVGADLSGRRARLSTPRRRLWAAAVAILLAGFGAMGFEWYVEARGHRFSRIDVENDGHAVSAVDQHGRQLWRREDVRAGANFLPFRPEKGGPLRIAAHLAGSSDFDISRTRQLSILDPQSGEEVDRLELAEASREFPGFAPHFGSNLNVIDLDGDGADEIVADYVHNPFWPSFSVLVEPRLRRSRVVLIASGHHRFKGAEDVDGDGRRELVYAGLNNRMGWHEAVAIVRAPDGLGDPKAPLWNWSPAMSVDRLARSHAGTQLLWYALAPRGLLSGLRGGLSIDAERREIRVLYDTRDAYSIDFDGFPAEEREGGERDLGRRKESRQIAYQALVEGTRLEEAFEMTDATAAYDDAIRSAGAAGLPVLELWLRQCRVRARAVSASWPEVRREMESILAQSDHPSEVAFDIGRALHRSGRLEEAVEAYRTSFTKRGVTDGRADYEVFEGSILALTELGRFADAEAQVGLYCAAAIPGAPFCVYFRQFVKWMEGKPIVAADIPRLMPQAPDLQRYWGYELRLAAGVSPAELLPLVEAEIGNVSEGDSLFESLAAELDGRLGRLEEAARRAVEARDRLELEIRRDFTLRASAKLVRERAARWAATSPAKSSTRPVPAA
jgi:hypothetical protein